jgi:hypothetical protein
MTERLFPAAGEDGGQQLLFIFLAVVFVLLSEEQMFPLH